MSSFSIETLRELFGHMEWADGTVWRVALAHPPAALDAKLHNWMLHIHVVQRAFLHIWTEQPVLFPQPSEFPDIAAVHRWGEPYYAEARQFLGSCDSSMLGRPLAMPWVKQFEEQLGRRFEQPTVAETMFQVTSHSTYHRGQVNARLRELGAEPPLVDFIAWVWFGKPTLNGDSELRL